MDMLSLKCLDVIIIKLLLSYISVIDFLSQHLFPNHGL